MPFFVFCLIINTQKNVGLGGIEIFGKNERDGGIFRKNERDRRIREPLLWTLR